LQNVIRFFWIFGVFGFGGVAKFEHSLLRFFISLKELSHVFSYTLRSFYRGLDWRCSANAL